MPSWHNRLRIMPRALMNKLGYRRGTARRAMSVNSGYVSRSMGGINVSNTKSDLKVVQGHWQWCYFATFYYSSRHMASAYTVLA